MLRVGLTGGIGSGKTTVCKLFEQLGVPVYYADVEAKKLYAESVELREKLQTVFGESVYVGHDVNKVKLKELLLESEETAEKLNRIVHPFVFEHYEKWCFEHASHDYTIKEAAILFESGGYQRVQKIVGVIAPLELRIDRVMKRDGIDRKEVEARINRQWPQEKWLSKCDYIIENEGSFSLEKQVSVVHSALLNDSKTPQPFVV